MIEIKHRYTGAVICTGVDTLTAVQDAVRNNVSLDGANLEGANFEGAYLARANFEGANLARANLARAYLARANFEGANLARANLAWANLAGANLFGANLAWANLAGANLDGAVLIGDRPIIQIGPIGSRGAYLVAYITDEGIRVTAGCFHGSLDEFVSAVADTHGDNEHGREYAAAIAMIRAHADIWTPKAGGET